ncbi:hypothetical protein [Paenibacillus faecalis]|uniref:hypothetical protein n=1 Tax=Paenibacillus faecalis TaxID=2079532 RepID=UPI000D10A584|nr:hypothetical protein [Paenibacillus faecalis]
MEQKDNARSRAAERSALNGVKTDANTDKELASHHGHPFAVNKLETDFMKEMTEARGKADGSASSLWDNDLEDAQWLNNWSGRVETHTMFRRSYEY